MQLTVVNSYSKASGQSNERGEFAMSESWMGIVIGSLVLTILATLIIGHYRREHRREQLLRRMDHRHCWEVMRRRH